MAPLLQYSLDEAREKGLKQGMRKGRLEGMSAGIEKGMEKERQQVVLNMLKEKADLAFISKVTGLSVKKLKQFKNGNSE